MNKLIKSKNNNNPNEFISLLSLSNGAVFFGRTFNPFENRELVNIRMTCKAACRIKILEKCINERYVESYLVLFERLRSVSTSPFYYTIMSLFNKSNCNLLEILTYRDCVCLTVLVSDLFKVINKDHVVDCLMIHFMSQMALVKHEYAKRVFLKNLVYFNMSAILGNAKGFELLVNLTFSIIASLNIEDRKFFQCEIAHMQSELDKDIVVAPRSQNIFIEYSNACQLKQTKIETAVMIGKARNDKIDYLTYTMSLSCGRVFFERAIGILETRDLSRLRSVCKIASGIETLGKLLRERKLVYRDNCMNLFQEIISVSSDNPFLCENSIPVFIGSIDQFNCNLFKLLQQDKCLHLIGLIDGLMKLIESNYPIDFVLIDFLSKIAAINDIDVRNYFIEQLLWFSYHALSENLEGFDLLKQFTFTFMATLNRKESEYLINQIDLIGIQSQKRGMNSSIKKLYEYKDYLSTLKLDKQKSGYKSSKKENCIIS